MAAVALAASSQLAAAQSMPQARSQAVESCKAELGKSARGTTLSACVTHKMDAFRTANNIKKTGKPCPASSLGGTC